MNLIMLTGRLGDDPESKVTQGGLTVTNLSLAVTRDRKNKDGNYESDWFKLTAFGKTAEFMAEWLSKGSLVQVQGQMQMEKWTTKDGDNRTTPKVIVDKFKNLSPKGDGGQSGAPARAERSARPTRQPRVRQRPVAEDPDDAFALEDDLAPF